MPECSPQGEIRSLSSDAIEAQLNFLQGEILTIADASFTDKEQRKAVKDLMRHQFKRRIRYIQDLCVGSSVDASANPYANNAG